MVCSLLFACSFYLAVLLIIAATLIKVYTYVTCGRHKITGSLKGKVVVITGGTAGIGKATVQAFAQHQATVHVLARDMDKAERVVGGIVASSGNQDIHIHYVDLCDFSTIRAFVNTFLATDSPIHILINNAGLWNREKRYTVDGNEETTQANHLGHFLLTNLLIDRMMSSTPGRIVNVSSLGHAMTGPGFDVFDINFKKQPPNEWSGFKAYCWTKLMNVLFTRELARRLHGKGVTVNCLHPGVVRTEIARNIAFDNIIHFTARLANPLFIKDEMEGAQTTLYAATASELDHVSGHYFSDCKPARMCLLALDDKLAADLWTESERLTGFAKATW